MTSDPYLLPPCPSPSLCKDTCCDSTEGTVTVPAPTSLSTAGSSDHLISLTRQGQEIAMTAAALTSSQCKVQGA